MRWLDAATRPKIRRYEFEGHAKDAQLEEVRMNSSHLDRATAETVQFAAEQSPARFPAGTAPAIAHLIERDREAERRREEAATTHPAQAAARS